MGNRWGKGMYRGARDRVIGVNEQETDSPSVEVEGHIDFFFLLKCAKLISKPNLLCKHGVWVVKWILLVELDSNQAYEIP